MTTLTDELEKAIINNQVQAIVHESIIAWMEDDRSAKQVEQLEKADESNKPIIDQLTNLIEQKQGELDGLQYGIKFLETRVKELRAQSEAKASH